MSAVSRQCAAHSVLLLWKAVPTDIGKKLYSTFDPDVRLCSIGLNTCTCKQGCVPLDSANLTTSRDNSVFASLVQTLG